MLHAALQELQQTAAEANAVKHAVAEGYKALGTANAVLASRDSELEEVQRQLYTSREQATQRVYNDCYEHIHTYISVFLIA